MKRTATRILTALAIAVATLVAFTVPAEAATKTVTIEIGEWWCVNGGKRQGYVASNLTEVVPGNNSAARWQSGRRVTKNVIYSPSGSKVAINATIHCKTWALDPGYYRYVVAGRWVDRNDHVTWWVV